MAFTYDSTSQDELSLLLSGRSYSGLDTDQKKLIDNNWSSGTVDGGAVKRALDSIATWAEFFTMDATAGIPDEWRSWVIMQAAAYCAQRFTTAGEREIRASLSQARRDALISYSRSDPEDTTGTAHLLGTVLGLRQFVTSHCLRLSRPLLPEPYMIDEAMQEVLRGTWDAADWGFQKQTVTLTIGTDSSVTVTDSLIIKRITSDRIFYTGSGNKGSTLLAVDNEMMLDMQTREYATGRPDYYRALPDAGGADGGLRFAFERTPDQEYTAKCEAVTSIGPMTTSAEIGAVITAFPVDMLSYLKKKTLATVLENCSRMEQARALDYECAEMLTDLMAQEAPTADPVKDARRQRRRGLGPPPAGIGGFV